MRVLASRDPRDLEDAMLRTTLLTLASTAALTLGACGGDPEADRVRAAAKRFTDAVGESRHRRCVRRARASASAGVRRGLGRGRTVSCRFGSPPA